MELDCKVEDLACIHRVLLNGDAVKSRELHMWFKFDDGPRLDQHLLYTVTAMTGKRRELLIETPDLREALNTYNGLAKAKRK